MEKKYKLIENKKVIYEVTEGIDGVTREHIDALYALDDQWRRSQLRYIAPNLRDKLWREQKVKWTPKFIDEFTEKNKRAPTKKEIDVAWREAVTGAYGLMRYDSIRCDDGEDIDVSHTDILADEGGTESPAECRLQELLLDMLPLQRAILYQYFCGKYTFSQLSKMYNLEKIETKKIIAEAVIIIQSDEELLSYIL